MTGRRFPNGQVKVPAQQPGEEVDVLTELLSTSSPGWYRYQLGGEVKIIAGLVQVPAQWGGQPPRRAGTGTSSVGRSSSLPGWYRYQLGQEVPAWWGGQPPRRAGTGTRSVGRSSSLPGWYRYQLGGEVNLLAGHPMDEANTGHPGHPVDDQVYDQYKQMTSIGHPHPVDVTNTGHPHPVDVTNTGHSEDDGYWSQ
ncbi:hypothetical protein PCASD_25251 [Puccinia coronata f. sp. avenae]|uniref:Uncharacterized protein n=1 Tax=Puccinia coronata f. sp. avenae TaxID=200324 RepID=A0A2N5TM15_9BASI|nr:hypothetical protein PCASD_25251 [Puccinia coronata f. sp. avenae]